MHTVGVSAVTGEGINDLMEAIAAAKEEYFSVFLESVRVSFLIFNDFQAKREAKEKEKEKKNVKELEKVTKDLDENDKRVPVAGAPKEQDVEIESAEEAKERKEFEELVEMANKMKQEKGII